MRKAIMAASAHNRVLMLFVLVAIQLRMLLLLNRVLLQSQLAACVCLFELKGFSFLPSQSAGQAAGPKC